MSAPGSVFGPGAERALREGAADHRRLGRGAAAPSAVRPRLGGRRDAGAPLRATRAEAGGGLPSRPPTSGWLTGPSVPEELSASLEPLRGWGRRWDMHSHNFCWTAEDWAATQAGKTDTETVQRIERLHQFAWHGVERMGLSAFYDPTDEGTPLTLEELDDITAFAKRLHPRFVLPFVNGFRLTDPDPATYVAERLAEGFVGVGEIIVFGHYAGGHGEDHPDLVPLQDICEVAAEHGAPILCHWEVGGMETEGATPLAERFSLLCELLAGFAGRFRPLKFILAHCGMGPWEDGRPPVVDDQWVKRIEYLLERFPNVWFDLAGAQADRVSELLADPGDPYTSLTARAEVIQRWMNEPALTRRFLFGLDFESRNEPDPYVTEFMPAYETFLSLGTWKTAEAPENFRWKNAERLMSS